jgi:hypothetical protein
MAPTKKNYAKAKVWGERITTTLEGPLMGVIQQMLTSVPADNHEYLLGKLKQISDDIRGITPAEPAPDKHIPEHTAGPWRNESGFIVGPDYPGKGIIATVNTCRGDDAEANGHLITAAPDLLSELEGCMKALGRMIEKHDPDSIEAEWIGHANQAIRNAKKPSAADICSYACGHDVGKDCAPNCTRAKAKGGN